jgi:CRP/FNR family cyclic AMP-dependent transcriptional regulator
MIRSRRDPKVDALSTIDVLAGASRRELQEICRLTTEVRIPAGQVLCTQGTKAEEVFLVIDGTITVSRNGLPLGVVGAGGIIGEMALMDGTARSATAVAATQLSALVLSASEFAALLQRFPTITANLHAVNAERTQVIAALSAA